MLMAKEISHVDERGKATMVDIGRKDATRRSATARVSLTLNEKTYSLLKEDRLSKGDALAAARLAGIMAAKKTSDLIPLCHQIPLDQVSIDFFMDDTERRVTITGAALTTARTGVEMEALTACAIAGLTLYDMLKSSQKDILISNLMLLKKSGGKSGDFTSPAL
ncbi:MAG: cyclic pyranopterin monophosphate synthase MoaC [Candidatus Zixiibacteriota bacterium]